MMENDFMCNTEMVEKASTKKKHIALMKIVSAS